MSLAQTRGGVPRVQLFAVTTGDVKGYQLPFFTSHIQIQTATNPVKVYFTEEDFVGDTNFVTVPVPAATHPWYWEAPAELGRIWLKATTGTSNVTVISFQRRT